MAALLRTPSLLSRSSSPPSSSSYSLSSPFQHPLSLKSTRTRLNRPNLVTVTANRYRGGYALKAVLDESPVLDPPPTAPGCEEDIATLKFKLLSIVSGLNRGLAASETDLSKADSAAKDLEAAGGLVDLSNDLDKLQGRWKLIYSSAFSSRTLGGSRPGPPTGRLLPITLGQVFQRIDVLGKDFDNIVELEFATPWPLPKAEATATLAHKFELIGCAKIKITFVSTTVKPTGSLSQLPPIEIPRIPDQFRPPSNTGSGEFEVTYVDSDTRITRGDKGELRVFVIS